MKKNYSELSSFIKSGLLLVGFLFFGISGFGQTIEAPTITNTSPCPGSSIEISFRVTNSFESVLFIFSRYPFTNNTNYEVVLYDSSSESSIIQSFKSNTRPSIFPGASAIITETNSSYLQQCRQVPDILLR